MADKKGLWEKFTGTKDFWEWRKYRIEKHRPIGMIEKEIKRLEVELQLELAKAKIKNADKIVAAAIDRMVKGGMSQATLMDKMLQAKEAAERGDEAIKAAPERLKAHVQRSLESEIDAILKV